MAFAPTIGANVRGTVMLLAVVVAIEQVGIQAAIVIVIVALVVGAVLAGAGLAFGIGGRTAVSNIIASQCVANISRGPDRPCGRRRGKNLANDSDRGVRRRTGRARDDPDEGVQ